MPINKHLSEKISNKFPTVDEKNMIKYSKGFYDRMNHVFYKKPSLYFAETVEEARSFGLNSKSIFNLKKEPKVNLSGKSLKCQSTMEAMISTGIFKYPLSNWLLSLLVHLSIFLLCLSIKNKPSEEKYIEVSFGLTDKLVNAENQIKSQIKGETQALKSKYDLPKLTKNTSIESEPKNSTLNHDLVTKESSITKELEEPSTNKETIKSPEYYNPPKENTIVKKNEKQRISLSDYLKRKEHELRKTGEENKEGTRNKNVAANGSLSTLSIPDSPFKSYSTLDVPASPVPTGVEESNKSTIFDSYILYLHSQLRMNWTVGEFSEFSKYLQVTAKFTVNEYGYLIGNIDLVSPSNNDEFNKLVIKSIQTTFPVSTPPPKELNPPQTFHARFTSDDVQ